ncbi:MAG: TIGR02147 family protein [Bdellovibrionales bacterium]
MENTNEEFRVYLQDQLIDRTKRNPKFSIRAFSRQLDIEPSSLSQIIHGKRKLTNNMCLRLRKKLGLTDSEFKSIMNKNPRNESIKRIQLETFKIISDWYHFAILELTHLDSFKGDISWISSVLGISRGVTQVAVDRLCRVGYLEISKETGLWKDSLGDASNTGNEFTEIALIRLQKQILEKAIDALEETNYEDRVQSAMTMAFPKKLLPQSKKKILNFINELNQDALDHGSYDEVYHLGVSLYPVSKINGRKK